MNTTPGSQRFLVPPNIDKQNHEYWGDRHHDSKNYLNIPGPFRMLITGTPNCGKTAVIYNVLYYMRPPPEQVYLIHADCYDSKLQLEDGENPVIDDDDPAAVVPEYKSLDMEYKALKTFPDMKWLDSLDKDLEDEDGFVRNRPKKVFIIDDINIKGYIKKNKDKQDCLDKLFSYYSTHRNMSIIVSFQNIYAQCTPDVRQNCDIYTLFKPTDKYLHSMLARNIGIPKEEMKDLFDLCVDKHDHVTIDNTPDSPAPRRFNSTKKLERR